MNAVVKAIIPGSPASRTRITPGDTLRKINGSTIIDVLDYKFNSYDDRLLLELTGTDGGIKIVRLRKPEGADIGLEFETFLMDNERSCANRCIFCFIDQLPEGMRETLYYKDDDVRLSFFHGNYITLTNLSRRDIERITQLRVSPINISIHTLDPDLRAYMLGIKSGAAGIEAFVALADAGIMLNCQIVCCPGINDGKELSRTMESLFALGSCINSVSVVPVGLTKHRKNLVQLHPFTSELALTTVRQVEGYSEKCLKSRGARVFFCADELYMMAGLKLPPHTFYEEYPQLENGVGMMRLFIKEFEDALYSRRSIRLAGRDRCSFKFSIATGLAASKYLTNLLKTASEKCGTISGMVYAIRNEFFGDSVTVSGLVTGCDLIAQLKGRDLGSALLIPQNMLKYEDDVFLDDIKVSEVSEALDVPVRVVRTGGADLFRAVLNET